MKNVADQLTSVFKQAILEVYPQLHDQPDIPAEIVQSTQDKFGHYQCNSAMKLAKILMKQPREIAAALVQQIQSSISNAFILETAVQGDKVMQDFESESFVMVGDHSQMVKAPTITSGYGLKDCVNSSPSTAVSRFISKMDIAGPGFINISLDPAYISNASQDILDKPYLGLEPPVKKERIIVEFSSPNTAKEMHVGHLRSTIIGDCLARLFEFLGHDVIRLNHIGDWGTAFGMLIVYMKENAPAVLQGKMKTDLPQLMSWYKASKQMFDADLAFKKRSQMEVVALQGGEKDALKAWEIICDISRKAYQEIYDLLDIKITERGESFYNPMLADTVADLDARGLIEVSDGAKCIFLNGFQNREGQTLPLMVQKSDGGYNYDTTDMAAMRYRIDVDKANRIIIITDAGQITHFQMIIKASEKAGYLDPQKVRVDHVPFGLVLGNDGKKFKTRSGETEKLIDLIIAAVDQANKILLERSPEMDSDERRVLAKALGIGAIKYADLSSNRISDYVFSYDRMLRFEGNTAAFLMYAYVRVAGIKRKIGADIDTVIKSSRIELKHPSEISLGMHLIQFGEALEQVSRDLLPNRLSDYLYGLAEKFNAFFRDCRVEGTPEQNSRLLLCEAVARTLKQGLEILGVKVVDKM